MDKNTPGDLVKHQSRHTREEVHFQKDGRLSFRHYRNGSLHRSDGPATHWSDGYKTWYINGDEFTFLNKWIPMNYWICTDEDNLCTRGSDDNYWISKDCIFFHR